MTKTKGKTKTALKKSRPVTRRAGGTDLLKIARGMDRTINATADVALKLNDLSRLYAELYYSEEIENVKSLPIGDLSYEAKMAVHMIRLAQLMRRDGKVDADYAFFLITSGTDSLYGDRCETDVELERIDRKHRTIAEQHGVTWPADVHGGIDDWEDQDIPDEVQKILDRYDKRCDEIQAGIFREHGETEMADLYLNDYDEFMRRCLRGVEKEKQFIRERKSEIDPPGKDTGDTRS